MLKKFPDWAQPLIFFVTQFFCYALFVLNGRAYNQGNYFVTVVSDLFFGAYGFFIIKAVGEAKHRWSWVGYMLGGAVGSVAGIWISKLILGA